MYISYHNCLTDLIGDNYINEPVSHGKYYIAILPFGM